MDALSLPFVKIVVRKGGESLYVWQNSDVTCTLFAGEVILISSQPPPLPGGVEFEDTCAVDKDGNIICTILTEKALAVALYADVKLMDIIIRTCREHGLLSGGSRVFSALPSPCKSPAKKKVCSTKREPLCRTSLFPETIPDMDRRDEGASHSTSPSSARRDDEADESLLNSVHFSNLPERFFEEHFLNFINTALWESGTVPDEEESAKTCRDYDEIERSVIVEFRTVLEATNTCNIVNKVCYDKCKLRVAQERSTDPNCSAIEESPMSPKVKITNLPRKLFKGHFLHSLNNQLQGTSAEGGESALKCTEIEPGTVIVEFRSAAEATSACQLSLLYESKVLLFEQLPVCGSEASGHSRGVESPEAAATTESIVGLGSKTAVVKFLRACIAEKTTSKFIATGPVLHKICAALRSPADGSVSIEVSEDECRSKIKRLYEQHRRGNCPYRRLMSYLKGEPGSSCPPEEDDMAIINKKGSEWSTPAILTLIDILIDMKEEYRRLKKNAVFWLKVSREMANRNHPYFDPDSCKKMACDLDAQNKDYTNRRKKSGNRTVLWQFFEPLQPLFGDSVSTQPVKTITAGAYCGSSINPLFQHDEEAEDEEEEPVQKRNGRERNGNATKKDEKKNQLVSAIVESRKDMVNTLKDLVLSMKSKKN